MNLTLSETHIRQIEATYPDGLSSQQLVKVFAEHQVRFSEANLRRYVQLGLVPRSRRVGQKGKHLGSHGLYPTRSVRRINTIKKLMAERYTIEEIQAKFLSFKDQIETLDEAIVTLMDLFQQKIAEQSSSPHKEELQQELNSIHSLTSELMLGVHRLEKLLIATYRHPRPRGGGAASPIELL